jgi:cytochrome b
MEASVQATEVRVWDPLVRSAHWLLAAAVLVDWATDEPLWIHSWLGYLAGAVVVVRVVWGFVGPQNARFVNFVHGPRMVFDYFVGLMRFSSKRYLGHSPAGGAMIVALLVMVAATAVTGWPISRRIAAMGRWPGSSPRSSVRRAFPGRDVRRC